MPQHFSARKPPPMKFSFPKKQHLAQSQVIADLSSRGNTVFKYPIKAYWLPGEECSRYAFSVPKKSFKRAVKRNLLKRRMREAVRLNQGELLGDFAADFLLVYIAKEICDYAAIEAAVRDILTKSRGV